MFSKDDLMIGRFIISLKYLAKSVKLSSSPPRCSSRKYTLSSGFYFIRLIKYS